MTTPDIDPTPAPADTVYHLPPAIVAALHTNRGDMVRLVQPADLGLDDVAELLRLLGDLIDDRWAAAERERETIRRLNELQRTLTGHVRALDDLIYGGGGIESD